MPEGAAGVARLVVRRNTYVDSVSLLHVSARVASGPGVLDASLVMATPLNREVLRQAGYGFAADDAGPNDLVIAVRGVDEQHAEAALRGAEDLLNPRREQGTGGGESSPQPPRSLRAAHKRLPDANLAVISVPGPFAAGEARLAVADGLNVFLFSDNVSLEDEVDLKRIARERGLLVMGPDCGTAILGGVGLGFANVVRRGGIGLVGASGTGLQEVSCLLHNAGLGISHAIGTGGRDLHAAVGGITTLQALDLLAADPSTHTIVLVSKPPSPTVAERVLEAALQTGKRVVGYLPGTTSTPGGPRANSLYETARLAANGQGDWPTARIESVPRLHFGEQQRQIRGLYCGGTLCDEAEATLQAGWAGEHVFVDFGDDRYTRGRAHPMIDPSLRNQAIVDAGHDPRVAVLLLDVILGYGAHANPAAAVAPAIRAAIEAAEGAGRSLAVFAHVVGTPADPQPLEQQIAALASAGVVVFDSNHHAALAAGELVGGVGR